MAQVVYGVLAFEMRQARIVPMTQEPATSAEQARRRAQGAAARRGGAVAVEMAIDEDTGVIDSANSGTDQLAIELRCWASSEEMASLQVL